jgi:superfamily II RNA helicase
MLLRLELEFENIDNQMLEVLDVEEIKRKESRIKKAFWQQQDDLYTSAHIKAGRKIMQALKKMRAKKETIIGLTTQGGLEQAFTAVEIVSLLNNLISNRGKLKRVPNN